MSTNLTNCSPLVYPGIVLTNSSLVGFGTSYYCAYLGLGGTVFVIDSPNGVTWGVPVSLASDATIVQLMVFSGQLVCGYLNSMSMVVLVTSTDGNTWTTGNNLQITAIPFAFVEYNSQAWMAMSINSGLSVATSSDLVNWTNSGVGTPCPEVDNALSWPNFGTIGLTVYNGDLYVYCQPNGDPSTTYCASTMFQWQPDSGSFAQGIGQPANLLNFGLINCQTALGLFFTDTNVQNGSQISYITSTDGATWSQEATFLNCNLYSACSGAVVNDTLVIAAPTTTNNLSGGGLLTVMMDSGDMNLPVIPASGSGQTSTTNSAGVTITSIYPALTFSSSETTVFLGSGSDGNYYLVSESNNGGGMLDFQLPFEPGPMIVAGDTESWLAFSCGTNVWVLDPLTTTAQNVFATTGTATFFTPVNGATNDAFLVQDNTGLLYTVSVASGNGEMRFVCTSYQLPVPGNAGIQTDGTYVYAYSSASQVITLYPLQNPTWGTPFCSTIPVNLSGMTSIQLASNSAYTMLYDASNSAAIIDRAMVTAGAENVYCSLVTLP